MIRGIVMTWVWATYWRVDWRACFGVLTHSIGSA